MGMLKHYLLRLITVCAPDNAFAQDAIEHAIFSGRVRLTGNYEADRQSVLSQYDAIIEDYQHFVRHHIGVQIDSSTPLPE